MTRTYGVQFTGTGVNGVVPGETGTIVNSGTIPGDAYVLAELYRLDARMGAELVYTDGELFVGSVNQWTSAEGYTLGRSRGWDTANFASAYEPTTMDAVVPAAPDDDSIPGHIPADQRNDYRRGYWDGIKQFRTFDDPNNDDARDGDTERTEFLSNVLTDSHSIRAFWSDTEDSTTTDGVLTSVAIRDTETGEHHTVTLRTVARGLALLSSNIHGNYSNSGYTHSPYGSTGPRLALLNRTNGEDSDYDAIDADAAIQMGLFSEVRYG